MTQTAPEKRFNLKDGTQPITFTGEQLAFGTSQPDIDTLPDRWTELAIYKTITGKYVLEKIGRSNRVHTDPPCDEPGKKPGKGALHYPSIMDALADVDAHADESDLGSFFVPCDVCQPPLVDEDIPVVVEQDMHSVEAYESPEKLIEALYYRKGGTVRSLSNLSRTLLDEAATNDAGIAAVRNRPTDIS